MTEANPAKSRRPVSITFYEELETATPQERTELVLNYIQEQQPLELPKRYGVRAILKGVDLSPDSLKKLLETLGVQDALWWDAQSPGANLREANLQGANLLSANLQSVNLWSANLQDANLGYTNLQGA